MGVNLNDYLGRYLKKQVLVYLNGNKNVDKYGFRNPFRGILSLIGDDFIVLVYGKSKREICIPIHSIIGLKLSKASKNKNKDEDEEFVAESHSLEK